MTLSIPSQEHLQECHTDLQKIFSAVSNKFPVVIIEGYRDEATQNKAYAEGKSKLRYPNSKHNRTPSEAVDILPYPIDWKDTARMYYLAGYVKAIAEQLKKEGAINHSIRWGGDWDGDTEVKDQTFFDLVHFELKDEN